jgi:hypothetical protein
MVEHADLHRPTLLLILDAAAPSTFASPAYSLAASAV